jgi:transcriptional regulator with XRE-family HTH domain
MQAGYVLQVTASAADWERTMTARIGEAIKDLRNELGMSAQKLSGRLAELGLDMSRASISALENGKRPYVTVTEVMLFARALNTSPIALIFPGLDYDEQVEVLPREKRSQLAGVFWFCGEYAYLEDSGLTDDPKTYAANLRALRLSRYLFEERGQMTTIDANLAIANSSDVNQIKLLTSTRARTAKTLAELENSLQAEIERRGG